MKTVTVTYGQTLSDVALQEYGCSEGIVLLAQDNDLSLTAKVEAGQPLQIRDVVPELTPTNIAVAQYFRINGIKPNSSSNDSAASNNNGYVTQGYVNEGYVN